MASDMTFGLHQASAVTELRPPSTSRAVAPCSVAVGQLLIGGEEQFKALLVVGQSPCGSECAVYFPVQGIVGFL